MTATALITRRATITGESFEISSDACETHRLLEI
jgi:hypothetical protein